MNAHANVDEWARYLEGQLTLNRSRELEAHLECAHCSEAHAAAKALREELSDLPESLRTIDLVAEVNARLATPAPKRGLTSVLAYALVPLAAACLLFWFQAPPPDPNFRIKSSAANADAWVGLQTFKITEGASRLLDKTEIGSAEKLAFAYRNIAERPFSHLMIFGLSADSTVYWYYPAYASAARDPESISIERGVNDLPDHISHTLPPGPLYIYGVFTQTPQNVKKIEALLSRLTPGKRLPLKDSGQHIVALEVSP